MLTVTRRFEVYENQTEPLIGFYARRGILLMSMGSSQPEMSLGILQEG